MIVVADSGPLHYLILLDQTELLPRFYGQVIVPEAVLRELTSGRTPQPVKEWLSNLPSWLRVQAVPPSQLELVTDDLDLGEREAIVLAHLLQADLLLIDEISGRAEARRRNLRVTGTLGILRIAAETELIDVPQVLARLRDTNFYVNEDLIRSIFGRWLDESTARRD
jgi:predicted nucleic acid-binding protein